MADGKQFERDVIPTSGGDLEITFLGHGTLMLFWGGKHIHVDPYGEVADYSQLPKADLVLITHEHGDHLDPQALARVRAANTQVVLTELCAKQIAGGIVMRNGDAKTVADIPIEAVPAYNVLHKRGDGQPFHPKGAGNGYVLTLGDVRVYVAGDTETIPEMARLRDIDCAFLPVNLPYTMTLEMAVQAARTFKPRILYPYHYSNTRVSKLADMLRDTPEIEVRIRRMA